MNRRGFLSFFGALSAAAALDPERLLWRAGEKLISIPRAITLEDRYLEPYDRAMFIAMDEARFETLTLAEWWLVDQPSGKIGDTIYVKTPQRFVPRPSFF